MVQVDPSEYLTTFIFSKNQFSLLNGRVKKYAFIPPKHRRLSVFRISELADHEVWEIGEKVGILRELPLLARADITVLSVNNAGLYIDADDNPPHHANIVGWHEKDSEIKLKATELAESAQLYVK
ncbi:MAG: hypothetical protein HQK89_12680 [Nitrospirae bacterium]|nr:hypothetical protein [Nitrospirota bacterium]